METTTKSGIEYTYKSSEMNNIINNTIDKIKNIVIENDYQVTGKLEHLNLDWNNETKTFMKKVQKACYWIERKPSLRRINSFFRLLSNNFVVENVSIKRSLKEEKIQIARKKWLVAREISDKLLIAYKKEKGDYYLVNKK